MVKIILYLLEKLPYRTRFGLSLADELKVWYYWKIGRNKMEEKCLCGGIVITTGFDPESWETQCDDCKFIYDED